MAIAQRLHFANAFPLFTRGHANSLLVRRSPFFLHDPEAVIPRIPLIQMKKIRNQPSFAIGGGDAARGMVEGRFCDPHDTQRLFRPPAGLRKLRCWETIRGIGQGVFVSRNV